MGKPLLFDSPASFERWLENNHNKSKGLWLKVYKKGYGGNVLRSTEVLDPLLCYGWITGQARRGSDEYALWWVCPRRKRSLWSKVNVSHAERLIREGRMRPPGLNEIDEAKSDGRWDAAYPPQKEAVLPPDFMERVGHNKKAKAFLDTLNRTNVYAIIFRLHNTRDPARRELKIEKMIEMLEKGETFH